MSSYTSGAIEYTLSAQDLFCFHTLICFATPKSPTFTAPFRSSKMFAHLISLLELTCALLCIAFWTNQRCFFDSKDKSIPDKVLLNKYFSADTFRNKTTCSSWLSADSAIPNYHLLRERRVQWRIAPNSWRASQPGDTSTNEGQVFWSKITLSPSLFYFML